MVMPMKHIVAVVLSHAVQIHGISYVSLPSLHHPLFELNKGQLHVGLIAQLVDIARVLQEPLQGWNTVQTWIFFRLSYCNRLHGAQVTAMVSHLSKI